MQVQLTIADENCKGQIVTINVPSFLIGRAKDCNLRSNRIKVSRHHCIIRLEGNAAIIQNLSEGGGTFVNGKRITSEQTLRDGDELSIGDHLFAVHILEDMNQAPSKIKSFFELPSSSVVMLEKVDSSETDISAFQSPLQQSESAKPKNKESAEEYPMMFDIRLDGQRFSVTKEKLFSLAQNGSIMPDDLVTVAGTKIFADSIQGIVFGDLSSGFFPTTSSESSTCSSQLHCSRSVSASPSLTASRNTSASRDSKRNSPDPQKDSRREFPKNSKPLSPAPATANPLDFSDFGEIAGEAALFQSVAGEPVVRVARMESTSKVLWNTLDITFSRVYITEGNSLVIHGIKAFYYVVAVACMIGIFLFWLNVAIKCHSAENALNEFSASVFPLTVVTIGCLMIIVIVRVLLEMLLLFWIESAKQEEQNNKNK